MLTTDTEAPEVAQTTVSADLLHTLQVVTEFAVDAVGQNLHILAVHDIALPIEEPPGYLVLCGVLEESKYELTTGLPGSTHLNNRHDSLELFTGEPEKQSYLIFTL